MSQKELQRVKVIENAAGGRLSVREACRLLHLSERQVWGTFVRGQTSAGLAHPCMRDGFCVGLPMVGCSIRFV